MMRLSIDFRSGISIKASFFSPERPIIEDGAIVCVPHIVGDSVQLKRIH